MLLLRCPSFLVPALDDQPDSRKVEIGTESMGSGVVGPDERLVEALVAYKDAVDNQLLLPISFV